MGQLKESQITTFTYTKDDGESQQRTVIPSHIPSSVIKAIDVDGLSSDEAAKMATLHKEYQVYVKSITNTIYNFENWVAHTTGETITPKWRSFKSQNISLIKD